MTAVVAAAMMAEAAAMTKAAEAVAAKSTCGGAQRLQLARVVHTVYV
jgi:hypothetical protein